jgi:hypothetical protein
MKIKNLSLAAFALCGFFTAVIPVFAQNWTSNAVPDFGWTSVASSADGSKLAAVGNFSIYTSTNSGFSWISNTPSAEWVSVASSADGNKLVAAANTGVIYTSTNAGSNWLATLAPSTNWISVASSADGTKLVAAAGNGYVVNGITIPGLIYTSTNSGINWTPALAPSTNWQAVASSADGTKLVAVVAGMVDGGTNSIGEPYGVETDGLIYISTNSGVNWTPIAGTSFGWNSVASSADGSKLIAASFFGQLYSSTDFGATWVTNGAPNKNWTCVASSADGVRLAGIANLIEYGGSCQIYTSTNSGANWTDSDASNLDFRSVAYSADGTKLVASVYDGAIYTLQTTPAPCLNIVLSCTNLALSWIVPSTNFVLQQSSDLTTTNWINVASEPVLNLTNLQDQTTLPTPAGNYFYRLKSQ